MSKSFEKILEAALNGESLRYKAIEAAFLDVYRRKTEKRIAKASLLPKATIIGKATASKKTANQLELLLDLVPFNVINGNRQAIDISEKQNLLETALAQPITANFDGNRLYGHKDTKPYGTITEVIDNGDRLSAKAVLWIDDDSQDLIDYIFATKTIGSSFELGYERSEERNGATWLYDTVFYKQALVQNPAYGDKTLARVI